MKYSYYPGCSLERNALAYHQSTMAVSKPLGIELEELDDWNCCGATEYFSIDALPAYALIGRNLALAAGKNNGSQVQLAAPCSACFLNLKKTDHYMGESEELNSQVNTALQAGGLAYDPGSVRVRHLLDIIVKDVGLDTVKSKVKKPLYQLKVAPYYGCLLSRPALGERVDDPEYPTNLDHLLREIGADVVDFPLKTHCCGGHMTQISEPVALELIRRILKNAVDYDADLIACMCPMCQLNLDAYQESVNKYFGTDYQIPIIYFTQLVGLALGLPIDELGFGKEFIDASSALGKIGSDPPKKQRLKRPSKDALPMAAQLEEN